MDRLNQLRSEAGGSGDSSLDTSSAASEAYLTANENSKYFSLLDETSFSISKDNVNSDQETADTDNPMISNLSPISKSSDLDSYKIGKQIEAANILSGGINIFEENENSYDGDELVIDDNVPETDEKSNSEDKIHDDIPYSKVEDNLAGNMDDVEPVIPSKDTEVVLQIDGKNVDAIDIGNGLYLYRKDGEEELAAVQIVNDDQQQSSFKFLKVRENTEGNLEVYEEIEIEVPKEMPLKEGKSTENLSHIPIKDISKVISEPTKVDENISTPQNDTPSNETNVDLSKESQLDSKTELNLNGKMMKFSESRKSPVVGSFTPMTFHSTPNKEGIPLTKTMVDQQLHPNRHSDNVKKTIEVHTDSSKQKHLDVPVKNLKEICETNVLAISHKECQQPSEENNDVKITLPLKKMVDNKDTTTFNNEDKQLNVSESALEICKSDHISAKKDELITQGSKVIKETPNNFDNEKSTQREEGIEKIPNNDTNNPEILKNKIIVDVKDNSNSSKGNVDSKDESNEKYLQECENILVEQATVTKKLDAIQNITVECNPETQLENLSTVEASKSETDVPVTGKQIESDSLKSVKDLSHLQNKNTNKVTTNTPHESENLTSNLTIKNHESVGTTLDFPKSSLIELETKNNKEQDLGNSKINVNKSTKDVSNHKATELIALASHPIDLKNKSETFQALNKVHSNKKEETRKEIPKMNKNVVIKAVSNNNAAVPFGKWTEANRQEFLNKIKETKVTTNNPNTKQLKQPNDLNRRDVLQKIDSQRQQSNNAMTKVQEQQKLNSKNETSAFVKSAARNDTKIIVKDRATSKIKATSSKKNPKDDSSLNHQMEPTNLLPISKTHKKESLQRREINNQALIDRTIEDIINRVPPAKTINEDRKQCMSNMEGIEKQKGMTLFGPSYHAKNNQPVTLNEIETKMNELHGIPFVERPAHELPQKFVVDNTLSLQNDSLKSKPSNVPNVLPFAKKSMQHTNEVVHIDSDEEIIEHEPITGDENPKKISSEIPKTAHDIETEQAQKLTDEATKDVIITEKDFDKFYRRNSVTYENCLTVNVDGKEPHNFVQTVVDIAPKKLTRNEVLLAESKAKSTHKQLMLQARHSNYQSKIPISNKCPTSEEESYGKNYQSKLQIAYQTAITAKRQKESPITIIEEKPVKVVFMDSNVDFLPCQLNVQGEKLSPIKQFTPDLETFTHSTTDSLDSDILDNFDGKTQDEAKSKSRHQRKQVLTPVDVPEMELIQSDELGIEITSKKKRRIEDRLDKSPKNHVPKKSYLLGRANADDKNKTPEVEKVSYKEINNHNNSFVSHPNPITAIDNLVKAAELLENQAENSSNSIKTQESESQQQTPPKRGRGRPRKYPLPDAESDTNKVPSPQKKPRLIDAKVVKPSKIVSREETDEEDTSDDEVIRENWTMGKINENIVCPICSKLFRSENVVFKHVKHCTGPSPNRSESDKRRLRESQESETRSPEIKSDDMDIEEQEIKTPKKRKSKESLSKVSNPDDDIIEETITKEKMPKQHESRKSTLQTKNESKSNNSLVCEVCGKSFRHLSYLAQHKLQHKNEDQKKHDKEVNIIKPVFSCEICKKEFRKLHHLVQHRIIHNPSSIPTRTLRKSSSEQSDNKIVKEQSAIKQTEDHSAGFRCEPCDKSFRKLHHLVEHRETHDGINRQKANEVETPKPTPIHQCDICDKTFRKLQLLNEHKEQHLETCSEKSDDKSVKSSLSTKDIIHECSLCYMVFPNEHSLNKHTVICLRKKKQSIAKAKQAALKKELEEETLDAENSQPEQCNEEDVSLIIVEDNEEDISKTHDIKQHKLNDDRQISDKRHGDSEAVNSNIAEVSSREQKDTNSIIPIKHDLGKKSSEAKEKVLEQTVTETFTHKEINIPSHIPTKTKNDEILKPKVNDTLVHKKKNTSKEKAIPTITKRQKSLNVPVPVIEEVKPTIESSDEDEVRYMLNPNFIEDTSMEERSFMKIKTKKRNSLHFERPSSRDLLKRRISMQLPPKMSRLRNKSIEQASFAPSTSTKSATSKANEKPTTATDSDDSETKYAFPETIKDAASTSEVKQPQKRKSIASKRKLLSGVAKRKSLGKSTKVKHKLKPEPVKPIKKRTTEMELRCDCGKLFSSAALLSRHTLLDHTPPRSRRRRSPLPEVEANTTKVTRKTTPKKTNVKANVQAKKMETADRRKPGVATRKSTTNNNDAKPSKGTRKSLKSSPAAKTPSVAAHKGVPVPDELRKHVAKQHLKNK